MGLGGDALGYMSLLHEGMAARQQIRVQTDSGEGADCDVRSE